MKAPTASLSEGAAAEAPLAGPSGDEAALRAIPQIEITVVLRNPDVAATERFTVPLAITSGNAEAFAKALSRNFTGAVNRCIEAYKKTL